MRIPHLLATIAAAGLAATSVSAQTGANGGVATSTPNGSAAGGASAGTMNKAQERRQERSNRREARPAGSTSSTYGAGSIYTDRNRATGGVTAGGTATGSGATASSTAVDAYGSTTREGSTGEVYGDSSAQATTPPQH